MIGETIGNFKVIARLGAGGMGEVYLAEQQSIRTKVAIKVLHAHISKERQHIERFFNEAVAVSTIKHAGIAKIFDVGFHTAGQAYLIMEFLDGESLAARLARVGQLPLSQVADLGRQTAGVLEATHAEGVTHRDLKPDNIFLVPDAEMASGERVKVLDFGIAKLSNASSQTGTAAGSMGTPPYMAPEQWINSGKVDKRADIYSLGCVMFETVCGRPPFVAESIGEACAMHLNQPPPMARSIVANLPAVLDALLARMLAKSPDDRPTLAEVASTFAGFLGGEPLAIAATMGGTFTPPAAVRELAVRAPDTTLGGSASAHVAPRAKRSKRGLVVGVSLGVLAAGGAAALFATRSTSSDPPSPPAAGSTTTSTTSAPPPPAAGPPATVDNAFVAIAPPPHAIVLGVDSDAAPLTEKGFRPGRRIVAPSVPYAIQEHEVTWSELDPWLASQALDVQRPPWAREPALRAHLPATGVTWTIAHDYCKSIGAALPTEEQWEYAARGAERRPFSWGSTRIDLALTHTSGGAKAKPIAVETSDQDQTPSQRDGKRIYDLIGNVQEWTIDLWRDDKPNTDEAWAEQGETSYRALRGLPLHAEAATAIQPQAAAYREPMCATGTCLDDPKVRAQLDDIGFRCVRSQAGTQVAAADPGDRRKNPIKPDPTKPDPTKPDPTKPDPTKPDPTKPDPTKPDPTKPDPTKPDPTKPDPTKPDPINKPDPTKPDPTKPDPTKPDPTKPDPTKPDPTKPDPNLPANLGPNEIKGGIAAVRGPARACGAQFPDAHGLVKLKLTVGPDGNVVSVAVESSPGNPGLGACVAGVAKQAHFVKARNGSRFSFTFPF